jgi:hypothetical protein
MMSAYHGFAGFNTPCSEVTQWSGREMKALGCVIVPVLAATLLKPLASHKIPITEALFCIKIFGYSHLMVQYQYHTEGKIEYMENYLKEFNHVRDGFSRFHGSNSTN